MCLSFAPPLGSNPGPLLFYKPFSSEKANPIRIPSIEKWYHLNQWRIQERGPGGLPPHPLRFFFGDRPPPPHPHFSKGLDDRAAPLSQGRVTFNSIKTILP